MAIHPNRTIRSAYFISLCLVLTSIGACQQNRQPETSEAAASPQPCRLDLSAPSAVHQAEAGNGSLKVTAEGDCAWTAEVSDSEWIELQQPQENELTYEITANTSGSARSAAISFKGEGRILRTFSVFQEGARCDLAVDPLSANVPADGTTGSLRITTDTNCQWTAERKVDWIQIDSFDIDRISYKIQPNTGASARAGAIQFLIDQKEMGSFWVFQEGVAQPSTGCNFSLDTAPISWRAKGGSAEIALRNEDKCLLQVTSDVDWVELPAEGLVPPGASSFSYRVLPNSGSRARTAVLSIAKAGEAEPQFAARLVLVQDARTCSVRLGQSRFDVLPNGSRLSLLVKADPGCRWKAESDASWIWLGKAEGDGDGEVSLEVTANQTGGSRIGTIRVADRALVIIQRGQPSCNLALKPESSAFGIGGGGGTFAVKTQDSCDWKAQSQTDWITIDEDSRGLSPERVHFTVEENRGIAPRTGTIRVGENIFSVTQNGVTPCFYALRPSHAEYDSHGGENSFRVSTRDYCDWQARSDVSWIQVAATADSAGEAFVRYVVEPHEGTGSRTGTITVGDSSFVVIQAGRLPCSVDLDRELIDMEAAGATFSVSVTTRANCVWSAGSPEPWIQLDQGAEGSGSGPLKVTIAANPNAEPREGTLRILNKALIVRQAGTGRYHYNVVVRDRDGNFLSGTKVTFHNGGHKLTQTTDQRGSASATFEENSGIAYSVNGTKRSFGDNRKLVHLMETEYPVALSLVIDEENRMDGTIWIRSQAAGIEMKTTPGTTVQLPYGTYYISYENEELIHTEVHTVRGISRIVIDIATMPNVYYRNLYRKNNELGLRDKVVATGDARRDGFPYFLARYWLARLYWDRDDRNAATDLLEDLFSHRDLWMSMNIKPHYVVAYLNCLEYRGAHELIADICEEEPLIQQFNQLRNGERDAYWRFQFLYHRIKALDRMAEQAREFKKRRYRKRIDRALTWIAELPVETLNSNPVRYQELKEIKARLDKRS